MKSQDEELATVLAAKMVSDITSSEVVPEGFIEDGSAETPVSEEIAHQRILDLSVDSMQRAKYAAELIREVADHIEKQGNLKISPTSSGSLVAVVVTMMQQSGWSKSSALMAFGSIWGEEDSDDGDQSTN